MNATSPSRVESFLGVAFLALGLVLASVLFLAPATASAASTNASLGGGSALARVMAGQSQGLTHTTSTSDLLDHLTFASTRGGRPTEVPPAGSNEGGDGGSETENEEGSMDGGTDGAQGDNTDNSSVQNTADGNGSADDSQNNNGGAQGGNGGNGGNAASGGLVRAGSVVSKATVVNMLNVTIVRISSW